VRSNRPVSLLFAFALGGCSIALSGPQPNRPRGELPKCDTGRGAVAVDGITAGLLGVGGLSQLGAENGNRTAGGLLVAAAALYGLAALHGDSATSQCRKAMDQFANEQRVPDPDDARPRIVTPTPIPTAQPAVMTQPAAPEPEPVVAQPTAAPKPTNNDPWAEFWREAP
jgi:hypothetical protein